jgi:quercetin dioxygenase-like cupin family protein
MLTRRGFVGCALCALAGFEATGAEAQALTRTVLSRTDGPAQGYETIEAKVEIPAGSPIARHKHYGIETSYIMSGVVELDVEGVGIKTYHAGDGFQVPPETPHGGKCVEAASLIGVYVVEKGKPLAVPV